MKKSNMINVSVEFVIDALQARYDEVKELWGCDASAALWEQALQLVEECGLGEKALKQAKLISEAKKYGSGVLSVVNGNDVLEQICF